MDGTQKLPQRITAPTLDTIAAGGSIRPFAFSLAAWLAYLVQKDSNGNPQTLNDPHAMELQRALMNTVTSDDIIKTVAAVCPDVLPDKLTDGIFGTMLGGIVNEIQSGGMADFIKREAQRGD